MKFISNLLLAKKIAFGYGIIMVIATFSGLIVFYNLQKLNNIDEQLNELNTKLIIQIKDYYALMDESYKLTNAWIYQPERKDKDRLVEIIGKEFMSSQKEMVSTSSNITADIMNSSIESYLKSATLLIESEKKIMTSLSADSLYSNDVAVDEAISIYEMEVSANFINFKSQYDALQNSLKQKQNNLVEIKNSSHSFMNISMIIVMITVVVIGILSTFLSNRLISKPINHLQNIIECSSKGELIDVKPIERKDEIGKINNSISELVKNLKDKTSFAIAIGKGDYNKELEIYSENDVLGKALINMRNSLKHAQVEDKKRDWFNTGLASISEVLRKYQNDDEMLYEHVIKFVVKYLEANQGSIFEVNEAEGVIELKSCYAYERKKYMDKRIAIGEGLVGQAVLEKESFFLTDVPQNYTFITSGVGEATPNCILIIPLIVNEIAYGVIEIASFKVFQKHEVDFANKIGESIASTVSTVKVNAIRKKLLEEAKIKEEELRTQEEEMRQNMEELHATQEQLRRQEIVLQEEHKKEIEELKAYYENRGLKTILKN